MKLYSADAQISYYSATSKIFNLRVEFTLHEDRNHAITSIFIYDSDSKLTAMQSSSEELASNAYNALRRLVSKFLNDANNIIDNCDDDEIEDTSWSYSEEELTEKASSLPQRQREAIGIISQSPSPSIFSLCGR